MKRECPNYLRSKGKVLNTILSDSKNSSSDLEDDCDGDGNNSTFMEITSIYSKDELDELNEELGEHTNVEEVEASNDENEYLEEGDRKIQDAYDALLEDCGKYAKVAKNVVKKMKKIEEDHNYTLVQLKGAKCEVEDLKEELLNAYSKIKFLELEVIQENAKVEHVSTKKLDNVLTSQKTFSNKTGLEYTNGGSSSGETKKEMKFVSAKVEEKPKVEGPVDMKKAVMAKSKAKGKSLPKNQREPQVKHFCHHYGIRGHTRPNYFKLHAIKRANQQKALGNGKGKPRGKQAEGENGGPLINHVMEMLTSISSCLASFALRFEHYVSRTPC